MPEEQFSANCDSSWGRTVLAPQQSILAMDKQFVPDEKRSSAGGVDAR
jgi:hypothetical protein